MSEETTMYEELTHWQDVIDTLLQLVREMESHEQDGDYITREVGKLFKTYERFEPDEDGVSERYAVDFEHPSQRFWKLAFEFRVFFVRTEE